MRRFLTRLLKFSFVGIVLATVAIGTAYWLNPAAKSPPLVDKQGIVLDAETEAKLTEVMIQAAREDDIVTINEYLKEGFTPNIRSTRGDTLLIVAAYHDSTQTVDRLLTHPEIDLEARNRMGLTAIAAAAFKGHKRPLQALLNHGANVNAANGTNQTAIMFAALAGKTECVSMLLAAGADPSHRDHLGNTATSLATTQGAEEVMQVLNDNGTRK